MLCSLLKLNLSHYNRPLLQFKTNNPDSEELGSRNFWNPPAVWRSSQNLRARRQRSWSCSTEEEPPQAPPPPVWHERRCDVTAACSCADGKNLHASAEAGRGESGGRWPETCHSHGAASRYLRRHRDGWDPAACCARADLLIAALHGHSCEIQFFLSCEPRKDRYG